VHVDGAGFEDFVFDAPDVAEEFFSSDRAASVGEEEVENLRFFFGELFGGSVIVSEGGSVEIGGGGANLVGVAVGLAFGGAAEDGVDAGEEFAGGEGFDDVVIGAKGETSDAVVFFASGGEDDDGLAGAVFLESFEYFEAAVMGEDEVEEDEVAGSGLGFIHAFSSVAGADDGVASKGQAVSDTLADGGVVFDD